MSSLAMAVVVCPLPKWNRSFLEKTNKKFNQHQVWSKENNVCLPTELRLLLSDKERLSANVLMLAVGVAMLAGRDRRRSFSFSERSGRFGVSCIEM